jgi:CBS-domain-containing membrane protein
MNRRTLAPYVAAVVLLTAGFVAGEINAAKYPHMAAAQKYGRQAFAELSQVDKMNGPEVDAHVKKAQSLLDAANGELEQAYQLAEKHNAMKK